MKLLFDANLSPLLIKHFSSNLVESEHVVSLGIENDDSVIWSYAQNNNFMIVSKDSDFYHRVNTIGFPPKLVWVKRGNCSTKSVIELLEYNKLSDFYANKSQGILILK